MKKLNVLIILLLFLNILFALNAEERFHVLLNGETLYAISRKYNVPSDVIMRANDLANPDSLKIGQKLLIPEIYTVVQGDTLYGIARKLQVPVDDLISSNKVSKNATLKVGTYLCIPKKGTTEKPSLPPLVVSTDSSVKIFDDPRSYATKKLDSKIIWPVEVKDISYLSGKIYGVSITSQKGEKVKAISSGTVISIGPYRGFGQVAFLRSKAGFIYVYGGLDGIKARPGDVLSFGDEIGTLGSDSLSGKPQLYLMVYNKDVPVDPAKAPRGF